MENEELKQYLISFAENALNDFEPFINVFGKDFVRKRLSANLDNIFINISIKDENTRPYYCMDKDSIYNNCIIINTVADHPLTISDIENNPKLQHQLLHELIHAIFRKTEEECQNLDIEDCTGILEFYSNGSELGRGLNEGLTEWICYKAGYRGIEAYPSEINIIRMLELAIGEENIIKLANGDIKGNVSNLLQMDIWECKYTLSLIDRIYENEKAIYETYGSIITSNDCSLDKSISHLEATIFSKYFEKEISEAQGLENISTERMTRLNDLCFCIKGGQTPASDIFNSRLPLQFKKVIYPELIQKYQASSISQLKVKNKLSGTNSSNENLPIIYKRNFFRRLLEVFMQKFTRKIDSPHVQAAPQENLTQNFKAYISNMKNFHEYLPKNTKNISNSFSKDTPHKKSSEHDL